MKIILIGFMCSGKSRVGHSLSKKLSWTHVDTDAMIAKEAGLSIAEIIRSQGESVFRQKERSAVKDVALMDNCIVSTGGGVPLNSLNRDDLYKNSFVVWLRVSPEVVLTRAGNLESRPLIDPHDPIGSIRSRMEERKESYATAQTIIDVDLLTPDQVADKVIEAMPKKTL